MKHKEEIGPLVKTKQGIYVINSKAEIGEEYFVKCPVCGNELDIVAKKTEADKVICSCKTVIAFVGKPAPSSEEAEPEEKVEPKKDTEKIQKRKRIKRNGLIQWGVWPFKQSYTLSEGSNIIGRTDKSEPSDIQIKDSYVSRRSVNIEVSESGEGYHFKFKVLRAANPVYVNGHEHDEGTSIYLNDGDTIRLGSTKLRFVLEDKT